MEDIAQQIVKEYSLGKLENFERIEIGVSSENYKISTSLGEYFLKKHRKERGAKILSIEKIEQFFKSKGFCALTPLSRENGELHYLYKNEDVYVVYPFIYGKSFERGMLEDKALENMAKNLARMHLLTKDSIPDISSDVSVYFVLKPDKMLKDGEELLCTSKQITKKSSYDILAERIIFRKQEIIKTNELEMTNLGLDEYILGHGDYHPGNIFFDENNQLSLIFDFDMAGKIPRMYELVRSIMLTCFEHTYSDERTRQAKHFLKSYNDLFPINEEEFRKGIDVFYFKSLSFWRERAHYYENDFRNDEGYAETMNSIDFLSKQRHILADELINSLK